MNDDVNITKVLLNILSVILTGGFLWVWNRVSCNEQAVTKVKDSLASHKLHLAEKYTPKDEFKEFKKEMSSRFDRLEDLIRSKL